MVNFPVEFVLSVGQTRQILLFENRGSESWFGENHDAGGRLQKMRAGPASDHKKEGVLHLPVKPDDTGQSAEDLALTALFQNRKIAAAGGGLERGVIVHAATSDSSRAARSFQRN